MRALGPVIINKDKENRERAHTNMRWTHNVCAHTRTAHPHCRCDKYGFSLVRIIHWGHLQDIVSPFEQPPTSQKQGFNERGQTTAVLTGGTRGWGGTQRSCGWLMEGRRGGWDGASGRALATSWLPRLLIELPPGQTSSGHQATDPCPPINTPPLSQRTHVWTFSSWKIITQQQLLFTSKCEVEKKEGVIKRIVCLFAAKVNMSMVWLPYPIWKAFCWKGLENCTAANWTKQSTVQ